MRRAAIGLVSVLLVLTGCGALIGSPVRESAWPGHTDRALGAALSALGTADIVLRAERRDRLPGPYVRVTLRAAQRTLDQETSSYRDTQPPAGRADEHAAVVARLDAAATVLGRVTVAASDPGDGRIGHALDDVRRESAQVERLRQRLVGR